MQMMEQSKTFVIRLLPHNRHHPVFPLKILLFHIFPHHSSSSVLQLLHPVEGGACLEPFDLCLIEAVVELQGVLAAVAVLQHCGQRLRRMRGGEEL